MRTYNIIITIPTIRQNPITMFDTFVSDNYTNAELVAAKIIQEVIKNYKVKCLQSSIVENLIDEFPWLEIEIAQRISADYEKDFDDNIEYEIWCD